MAFADAGPLLAAEKSRDNIQLAAATEKVSSVTVFAPVGIDPIITGPSGKRGSRGILHLLDGCDADCQAKSLGLSFD